VAYFLAFMTEMVMGLVNRFVRVDFVFNRAAVEKTCITHYFSGERMEKELGYKPRFSYEEAMKRSLEYWKDHDS
jgi:nucleoside-diphosphate-sugar epimerase